MNLRHIGSLVATGAAALMLVAATPAHAIVGGAPDGTAHPNVGAMVVEFQGTRFAGCTGTLIAPRVFLTAAHCVRVWEFYGLPIVGVSFDSVVDTSQLLALDGPPIVDPGFPGYKNVSGLGSGVEQKSDLHDLAVLILKNAVPLTPVTLPTEGLLDELAAKGGLHDQVFTAVGYGLTEGPFSVEKIPLPPVRRSASSPFQSLDQARLFLSLREGGGACVFDSGGPAFLPVGGHDVEVSVNSFGPYDPPCLSFDANYRLDTPEARAFLSQFVSLP